MSSAVGVFACQECIMDVWKQVVNGRTAVGEIMLSLHVKNLTFLQLRVPRNMHSITPQGLTILPVFASSLQRCSVIARVLGFLVVAYCQKSKLSGLCVLLVSRYGSLPIFFFTLFLVQRVKTVHLFTHMI